MAIITSQSSPVLSAVACKAKEEGPFMMPLGASEEVSTLGKGQVRHLRAPVSTVELQPPSTPQQQATPHFPCKLRIAITLDSHILITMKTAVKKKVSAPRRRSISKKEISARLADLDLAQTSAIRDLEMDINGEDGIDSTQVLAAARKALA
jgi:hypothetical protein